MGPVHIAQSSEWRYKYCGSTKLRSYWDRRTRGALAGGRNPDESLDAVLNIGVTVDGGGALRVAERTKGQWSAPTELPLRD